MITNMQTKAGNHGDRMKHAILLNVLSQCETWERLKYAETHAGQGIYLGEEQNPWEEHIRELQRNVLQQFGEASAGGEYLQSLKDWWSDLKNIDRYPGSVLLALRYFRDRNRKVDFEVHEAHRPTGQRLREAVSEFDNIEPRLYSFQGCERNLTHSPSLVMLIDPFVFNPEEESAANGSIDFKRLWELFDAATGEHKRWDWPKHPTMPHRDSVTMLWCCFAGNDGDMRKGMVYGFLQSLCQQRTVKMRCFHHRYYCMFVVGSGRGVDVVDRLPWQKQWEESWLADSVNEGLY